jgi:trimethylamine--corrinoid protein Co-methyltransferase
MWQEGGSKDAATRANAIWKKLLSEYVKPAIDPAIEEELTAYAARRNAEIAASA